MEVPKFKNTPPHSAQTSFSDTTSGGRASAMVSRESAEGCGLESKFVFSPSVTGLTQN